MKGKTGERDFRDLKPKSGQKAHKDERGSQTSTDRRWWALKGDACAESIASTVTFLQKAQSTRLRQQAVNARLYGNLTLSGAAGAAYARLLQQRTTPRARVTYNAIGECTDTLVSRIGEDKPRPYHLTDGGDYRQQRRAKKANEWTEGCFYENDTYTKTPEAARDAIVQGDGFIHVFGRAGQVRHEAVMPAELWVDEVEAQYGAPRGMFRAKDVDRDELAGWFPEAKEAIERATRSGGTLAATSQSVSDMVTVVECWRLGVEDDAGEVSGGFHAIALASGGCMLVEPEDWPFPWFPFARLSWCTRPTGMGYWSQGLAEQLQGEQMELNAKLSIIQKSMHLAGTFKVLVSTGGSVAIESINNEMGTIIKSKGGTAAPQYIAPEAVQASWFQEVERHIQRMRDRAGLSQMSTHGTLPQGVEMSGKAMREIQSVESDRHKHFQAAYNAFHVDIARKSLAIADDMSKSGKLRSVRMPGKRAFTGIDFKKDVGGFKDSAFVTQCFPVSRLPKDPAGRLQTIQEYVQAGFLTPRQGRRALDFPDLEAVESLANAQEDVISRNLDAIIDDGKYNPPEPTDDLALSKEMVLEYIQRYRLLGLEDDKLDMLKTYSSQVDTFQGMAASMAAPPPGMGAPGGAQAVAAPPPVSQLLPNAPGAQA
jgi:hypothetical protein